MNEWMLLLLMLLTVIGLVCKLIWDYIYLDVKLTREQIAEMDRYHLD